MFNVFTPYLLTMHEIVLIVIVILLHSCYLNLVWRNACVYIIILHIEYCMIDVGILIFTKLYDFYLNLVGSFNIIYIINYYFIIIYFCIRLCMKYQFLQIFYENSTTIGPDIMIIEFFDNYSVSQ